MTIQRMDHVAIDIDEAFERVMKATGRMDQA
jgi:hypothetical protein